MFQRVKEIAIEAMFPRFCVGCAREGELWCGACDHAWQPQYVLAACPFCHKRGSNRVCSRCRSEVYLDGISACMPYGNPVVRKAISVWKYDQDREIESILETWVRQSAVRTAPPLAPYSVCSVPLHIRRKRLRGFDQAHQVAAWAGEQYRIPVVDLLERVRATTPQARRQGRKVGELDGVFRVKEGVVVPEHVLLCDDVFTSGATMDAAARILKEAGAKRVWGWVLARGS